MEAVGPFLLREPLGEGGMGTVYRAVHRDTGEEVALKTLRAPTLELGQALRREVRALAALRHPGIVRIVDSGTDAGRPWYAMELVRGRTLRSVGRTRGLDETSATMGSEVWWTAILDEPARPAVSAPREEPADLHHLLCVVQRLCGTLAFLHGEGVVHRDLKPDNVMVRADGWPVLVDFGIVAGFGGGRIREATLFGPMLAGTAPYMAPEQCRGELVDARADLYSVGCLLYDLVTGAPPFVGRDPALIWWAHQNDAPEPPSRRVPHVPAELDALVLRLLAKDPRDRFGYAIDVARALSELTSEPVTPLGPPPRPHLCRPGYTGQSEVADRVRARLERGGLTIVAGAPGQGRTRLVLEAARWARSDDRLVLVGETGSTEPLSALAPALRRIAPGLDLAASGSAALRPRVFERVLGAVGAFERPCFVALDDLHRADPVTIELLAWLSHQPEVMDGPLHVLASCPTADLPVDLVRLGPAAVRLDLRPLQAPDVRRLASEALGLAEAPAAVLDALVPRAEGSPMLVGAFLQSAVALGLLERDATGRWVLRGDAADLPRTAHELAAWRLAPLELPLMRVVRALAVLRCATAGPIAQLAGAPVDDVEDALGALARAEVVDEASDGWRLGDRLAAAALAPVPAARRTQLHLRAAEVLTDAGARASAIAPHLEAAGERERALTARAAAAADAERRFAVHEAIAQHRAWLALADPGGRDAVDVRLRLATRLRADGRHDEGLETLDAAFSVAETLGEEVADAVRLARAELAGGDVLAEATAIVARARARGDAAIAGEGLHLLARVHRRHGRVQAALDAFAEAATQLDAAGAARPALSARHGRATLLGIVGRHDEAEAAYLALAATEGGDALAGVHWGLAVVAAERGRCAAALAHLDRAQERVDGAGWNPQALAVAINRSYIALIRGEADDLVATARHVVAKADYDPIARAIGRMNEAVGLFLAGRRDEAAQMLDEAQRRLATLGAGDHSRRAAWWGAWFALERADLAGARARLEEARHGEGAFDGRVLAARIAREGGDPRGALATLEEAWPPREGISALMWWCERGSVALALGEDATDAIEHASALFAGMDLPRAGPVGARFAALEASLGAAHARGP